MRSASAELGVVAPRATVFFYCTHVWTHTALSLPTVQCAPMNPSTPELSRNFLLNMNGSVSCFASPQVIFFTEDNCTDFGIPEVICISETMKTLQLDDLDHLSNAVGALVSIFNTDIPTPEYSIGRIIYFRGFATTN